MTDNFMKAMHLPQTTEMYEENHTDLIYFYKLRIITTAENNTQEFNYS